MRWGKEKLYQFPKIRKLLSDSTLPIIVETSIWISMITLLMGEIMDLGELLPPPTVPLTRMDTLPQSGETLLDCHWNYGII